MSDPAPISAPIWVHPTAMVEEGARLGAGTRVWHNAQVRAGAVVGSGCILGKDVYVDTEVIVGDNCKIQNGAYLYRGVVLEDGVFVGPRVTTTNDRQPRAIRRDGTPKGAADWVISPTRVCRGAALGAGSVLVCGITIGSFATVAAGAVVTRDVPPNGLVMGNPARIRGAVCPCGARLTVPVSGTTRAPCGACGETTELTAALAAAL